MSVVFSDNFNAGQAAFAASWTRPGSPRPNVTAGGVDFTGYWFACSSGQAYHTYSSTNTVNCRMQLCIINTSPSYSPGFGEFLYVGGPGNTPGFLPLFIPAADKDGNLYFRTNNVLSAVQSPSSGLVPVDGTMFGFQLRLTKTGSTTLDVVFTVNDVDVWSFSYNWGPWVGGSGGLSTFNRVDLIGHTTTDFSVGIDNLEIDDSAAAVSWPAVSGLSLAYGCYAWPVGYLIVYKHVVSGDPAQSFSFSTTGGLTPSTFSLTDGNARAYNFILPGTYGIIEDAVADWNTSYTVSNGSPNTAITVGPSETVLVHVYNQEIIPVPGCVPALPN